jgi:hypothetical protein
VELSIDFSDILAMGKSAGEVEAEKARATKNKKATKRKGKKREKFGDTPLTKDLVYKVMDITGKTVYFCGGLGATEKLVDELDAEGHTLYEFATNIRGNRLRHPRPYQCVLSSNGRHGYRAFWRPGTEYTRCKVIKGETTELGLFTVQKWPVCPGGIYFKVAKAEGGLEEVTEPMPGPVFAGKFERMEKEHLAVVKQEDEERIIVNQVTDERDLISAVEAVLNASFSEHALRQALRMLERGTIQFTGSEPHPWAEVDYASDDRARILELEALGEKLQKRVDTLRWARKASLVRWEEENDFSVWDLLGEEAC